MPIQTEGIIEVDEMLIRVGLEGRLRTGQTIAEQAKKLQELAIRMAPVDKVNLEKAIKMDPPERQARDEFGRFAKVVIDVYVDTEMEVPDRPDKTVGDYAWEMHEHLDPAGPLNLGDKSVEKQLANPDVLVGGKFLERAADQIENGLDTAFMAVLQGLI